MTTSFLLELREKFFLFMQKREKLVKPAVKFVIAFFAFLLINKTVGYMSQADNMLVVLGLAVLCAFTPSGVLIVAGAVLILLHFYALAMELCMIALLLFVLMFCLYFRFTKKIGYHVALTSMFSFLRFPYIMPVAVGLTGKPYNVISVICGSMVYFLVKNVKENEMLFRSFEEGANGVSKYTLAVNQIFVNKEMFLFMAAFVAAAVAVYFIRKLKVDHAWTVATIVGIVIQLVIVGGGEIFLGRAGQLLWVFIGCVVSLLIALAIQFMIHSLDYSRVENVQFEDDEYYYYVKAVPKSKVAVEDKKVQQISSQGREKVSQKDRGEFEGKKAEGTGNSGQYNDELRRRALKEFESEDGWIDH